MDDGTKLKPWGAPPIVGVFAIAFEVPPPDPVDPTPTSPLVFTAADVSRHNLSTKTNGRPVSELTYQGDTLVRFVPNSDSFVASFEQVGRGENGSIRGFLVLETSVGTVTQTVVNSQIPAGVDVNAVPEIVEATAFRKEEGRYMFTLALTRPERPVVFG
jgi:hypothetical protein